MLAPQILWRQKPWKGLFVLFACFWKWSFIDNLQNYFTFQFLELTDSAAGGSGSTTECPICLDTVTNARTLKCKHVFCTDCVETALKHDNRCPVCKDVQGAIRGNQPAGQMQFHKRREHLPGYNGNITLKGLAIKGLTNNHDVLIKDLTLQINAQPIQM